VHLKGKVNDEMKRQMSVNRIDEPSAFSIMRGCLPSITATAEFVVPRSIPMTWPLTFSSEYCRTKDDDKGFLKADVLRAVFALGRSCTNA
jgi:hypothetical protein